MALVIWPARSATRESRVANTLSSVAIPDSKKMGVRATWITWATKSSEEETVVSELGIKRDMIAGLLFPLERRAVGELGIEIKRILRPSLQGRKIYMHQANPLTVALRPFKTIEERPSEIPADR
jgi:hypothetical protein